MEDTRHDPCQRLEIDVGFGCCLFHATLLSETCHLCVGHDVGVATAPSAEGTGNAMFAPMAVAPCPMAVHDPRPVQLEVDEHRCGL